MSVYKEFILESLSASTTTAGFKLYGNFEISLQAVVADPTTFDADIFIQLSNKREEPSTDGDWFTIPVDVTDPTVPFLTLSTAGTSGESAGGAIAKWCRIKIVRNTGSADVTLWFTAFGGDK